MFPEETTFDEAARFLLRQGGGPLLAWLLEEKPEALRFCGWLDSVLSLPGTKERLCDAIARMETEDGAPHALIVEVQTRPDPSMFGRLSIAGGILFETVRPNNLTGDRYALMALVINLTGVGHSGQTTARPSSIWNESPCERDLADRDAAVILAGVAAGTIPPSDARVHSSDEKRRRRWYHHGVAGSGAARAGPPTARRLDAGRRVRGTDQVCRRLAKGAGGLRRDRIDDRQRVESGGSTRGLREGRTQG